MKPIILLLFLSLSFNAFGQAKDSSIQELPWLKDAFPNLSEKDYLEMSRTMTTDGPYILGEDSKRQDGIPVGKIIEGHWVGKNIYAGVERDYWIYVPVQYDGSKPANFIIFQDGNGYLNSEKFQANVALDNLIAKKEIPVTIGLFIMPGKKGPGTPIVGGSTNRSFEYDAVNDLYGRFLIEEIIPMLKKDYKIIDDPFGRALVGYSSSGNCAFTAAWHFPNHFGNVISHCGSFVNIRGGDVHHENIRRQPKKNIRVFLQSGENDTDIILGNLPLANKTMAAALEYAGYDYLFVFGEGGHTRAHGGAIFPETLRWMWGNEKK